jgi:putative membrane protein
MTRILMSSAALAALLSACATPPPPPPPPPPVPVAVVQPQLSQAGMDCVLRLGASDAYEIQAAQVALQRSTNPDVRNFAQMMIDQHTQSTQQMAAALHSINMNPPPIQLTADLNARLGGLQAAPNFDAAYLQDQIAAHQDALALAQSCAANGGPPVAAVAAGLVPAIQDHLSRAQAISANLGAPRGERG